MKQSYIFVFLLLAAKTLFSQADYHIATEHEKNDFFNHLSEKVGQFSTLQCHFTQEKEIFILSETIISEGVAIITSNNNMFCHYQKPNDCKYIINGDKLLIESNGKQNILDANANKKVNEIKDIILNILYGKLDLLNNYEITFLTNEKLFSVSATPKKSLKSELKEVKLTFNKEKNFIESFEFIEKSDDKTKITLSGLLFNANIDNRIFNF